MKITLLFLIVFSSAVYAADPLYNSHKTKGAIQGYDTVAYFNLAPGDRAVKGKRQFSYVWQGAKWYFSTAENLGKFKKDPEAYAPQYGGYCSFAAGKNFITSIRPHSWQIHGGKLYLNHNNASRRYFNKNIAKRIAKADANWPEVLEVCERRGNCRNPPVLD